MNTSAPATGPGTSDQLVPIAQAAQLLAVHTSTIRRWIREGKLPAYRVGDKGVRVRYGDVMRLSTPLSAAVQDKGRHVDNEAGFTGRLTEEEQLRALEAVASARKLREEFRARYGTMTPEAWELLNESRDERTSNLIRGAKE